MDEEFKKLRDELYDIRFQQQLAKFDLEKREELEKKAKVVKSKIAKYQFEKTKEGMKLK